ncbi:hypothetical protein J551_4074 [Acinetobacter sp. 1475718]|nr:hypothetical protein J551_4074 [Acinetobacter sp. 1475718]
MEESLFQATLWTDGELPASASSHSYVVMEEVKETLYLDVSK